MFLLIYPLQETPVDNQMRTRLTFKILSVYNLNDYRLKF